MTIHLVEDNADMLESLRMLLELRGHQVRTYLRALDLVDNIESIAPDDIVISDYYLPDINGVALLRKIRESHPRLKGVLLTGSRENGIAASAKSVPNCAVLYKPLDIESLERSIRQLKAA
jgi:DNA-binding NtrC family response regulator